jgi:predicted RecA/RadA family phage recombinase
VLSLVTATAVLSGAIVKSGQAIGVAITDAAAGATVETQMSGVFDLPKAAGAIAQGDPLYFDPAAKVLTKTKAAGLTLVGVAELPALAGDATVRARLDGVTRLAEV